MTTFAAAAADRRALWSVLIRIEGVGDTSGRWTFVAGDTTPYGDATWRPWFREGAWPSLLSERVEPRGGIAECGELSFELIDIGDALTAAFRVSRDWATQLAEDITVGETAWTVSSAANLPATPFVVYVGAEAVLVTARVGTTLTVTRAALGTDEAPHVSGDPLCLSLPYLRGRRVELLLVPTDADTDAEEQLLATYVLDGLAMSDDLHGWQVTARSFHSYLGRLALSRPRAYRVSEIHGDPAGLPVLWLRRVDATEWPTHWSDEEWGGDAWFRIGDELVRGTYGIGGGETDYLTVTARGQLGSPREELKVDVQAAQVYVADETGHGSFRYSPGPSASEDRQVGTWVESANWIDLILCLLTSSATEADALELVNHPAIGDNHSSLPVGVGVGLPHALIDYDSFLAARQETSHYRFPAFVLEGGAAPVARIIEDHFLRLVGAALVVVDGRLRLVMPRLPLASEPTTEIGPGQILTERDGGTERPLVSARQDLGLLVSAVMVRTQDPDGAERRLVVIAGDAGVYGPAAYYAADNRVLELEAPSARPDAGGASSFLAELAQHALAWYGRPLWRLTFETDLSLHALAPGDVAALIHGDLPDTATGRRGWTSVPIRILERTLAVSPGEDAGARYTWTAITTGAAARAGRIAPAAVVTSVVDSTATCEDNRYTQADAVGGLPTTDVGAFAVGDVVRLSDLDGVPLAGGATETVVSIDELTGELELSGDFGGALAADTILSYAGWDDSAAAQAEAYAHYADEATRTTGTDGAPWEYAA